MMTSLDDTIAAIATPLGEGAISVIRVSGNDAIKYIASIFKGKYNLREVKSHTAHFGRILEKKGDVIDEVVCTIFLKPHSFTGENTVEISCHGGLHITKRVFERILEAGVRPAKPGEFTKRAFLNGKIDLTQAEAIADLIHAQSDKAYRTSIEQLEGRLSVEIKSLRNRLIEILSLLELELDFIEEDVELVDKKKVEKLLSDAFQEIDRLSQTYKYGRVWREGIQVAIIGTPNAGKSSLLNALLKRERAIVTEVPGTTRDLIEEKIVIDGVIFRLIDTAGVRHTDDPVEIEGVKRTKKVAKNADILIVVHDSTLKFSDEEKIFIDEILKKDSQKKIIIANNKVDLKESKPVSNIINYDIVHTSTVTNIGIDEIKRRLGFMAVNKNLEITETATITNERHYGALLRAREGLDLSLTSLRKNESNEFIASNLRMALDAIGEIVGIITTEEILNQIFSKFCIGK